MGVNGIEKRFVLRTLCRESLMGENSLINLIKNIVGRKGKQLGQWNIEILFTRATHESASYIAMN